MLATSRATMDRIVDQILQPERFRVALRDLVSIVTDADADWATGPGPAEEAPRVDPYEAAWMPRFCELLAETGSVVVASARLRAENPASPARSTIYVRRERCPRFAREWDEAQRGRRPEGGPE